jgi:hypothetical protein
VFGLIKKNIAVLPFYNGHDEHWEPDDTKREGEAPSLGFSLM